MLRIRRSARLLLIPQGIGARGRDGESWLDWDDVAGVQTVAAAQHTVLRVVGAPNAPSWRWCRRRRVLFASQPRAPWVDIPGPALDVDPRGLVAAVRYYAQNQRARTELAGEFGRWRIVVPARPAIW